MEGSKTRFHMWLFVGVALLSCLLIIAASSTQASRDDSISQFQALTATITNTRTATSTLGPIYTRTPAPGSCYVAAFARTDYTTGQGPHSVAVADLNQDGHADLVTGNDLAGSVSVLLGNGVGGFGPPTNFPVASGSRSVAVADLDHDGNMDVATANIGSTTISVLLGNGTGSLGAPSYFPAGNQPRFINLGDFNRDGNLDAAVVNGSGPTLSVLMGDGAGGFGPATQYTVGGTPWSVGIADLNGDNNLDLAVPNMTSANVSILLGNANGVFGATTNYPMVNAPMGVAIADYNRDGTLDLAINNFGTNNLGESLVSVLPNTGTGNFPPATNFSITAGAHAIVAEDFNLDGYVDIATASEGQHNVSVILGNGEGRFGPANSFHVSWYPRAVAVGDFNEDGRADIATANITGNNVSVLLNTCAFRTNTPTITGTRSTATNTPAVTRTYSPTRTQTITPTTTPTSNRCRTILTESSAGCEPPSTFRDNFIFTTTCSPGTGTYTSGYYTVYFQIATSADGPWTNIGQQYIDYAVFPQGTSSEQHTFIEDNIPPEYTWFRMVLHGYATSEFNGVTPATSICSPRDTATTTPVPTTATYTPAMIFTPSTTPMLTLTPTPTPTCCDNITGTASASCTISREWISAYRVTNSCDQPVIANGAFYLEGQRPSGSWEIIFTWRTFNDYAFPPGDTHESYWCGSCVFDGYSAWRTRLHLVRDCWEINVVSNALARCNYGTPTRTPTPTYTPTPTITPTYTRTPTPAQGVIMGHLTWQGIPQPNFHNAGITSTLTLCSIGVPYSYTISTDADGLFTVGTGLPNGIYNWQLKGPKWLATSGNLTISGGTSNPELGIQRAGDADNSNTVNSQDFNILKNTFGKPPGDPGYDSRADFNNDNGCNVADFNLLKGNFGSAGAMPNCP